jgi:hypothetical protein
VEDDDLTADGFAKRCDSKSAVAKIFKEDRDNCREAWVAAGFAVEFKLKQLIMARRGYNTWPSKELAPELYVHNIKALFVAAGIDISKAPPRLRAAIRLVLDWERLHDYSVAPMPRKVARDMYTAALGEEGVVRWLQSLIP